VPGARRRAALGGCSQGSASVAGGKLPEGAALAILLQDASPAAIQILLDEVRFGWHETLGVPPNADAGTIRRAWARLAHAHHPDKGGTQEQMARLNAAYERAGRP
jgi:DnaJ-domain-containing protein 1